MPFRRQKKETQHTHSVAHELRLQKKETNIIAEIIYSQMDDQDFDRLVLEEIVDHRRSEDAVTKKDGFIAGHNGTRQPKKATKGLDILVQYKNGQT